MEGNASNDDASFKWTTISSKLPCAVCSQRRDVWDKLKRKKLNSCTWYKLYCASVFRCRRIICRWLNKPVSELFRRKYKAHNMLKWSKLEAIRCRKWNKYSLKLREGVVISQHHCSCKLSRQTTPKITFHNTSDDKVTLIKSMLSSFMHRFVMFHSFIRKSTIFEYVRATYLHFTIFYLIWYIFGNFYLKYKYLEYIFFLNQMLNIISLLKIIFHDQW